MTVKSCVAVGYSQGGAGPPMLETWNGAKWTLQTASIPGDARSTYPGAVSCHSDTFCVVAGESYSSIPGAPAMLLAKWNGKDLTAMKAEVPADAWDVTLSDVSCPSTTLCAAAGFSTNRAGTSVFGFAEMWDGKSWAADKMTAPEGDAEFCAASPAGRTGPASRWAARARRRTRKATATAYNGKEWTAQDVPGPRAGTSSDFFGVNCLRADQCVAIGETESSPPTTITPLGGLWSEPSWRLVAA